MQDGDSSSESSGGWPYRIPTGRTVSVRDMERALRRAKRKDQVAAAASVGPRPTRREHCIDGARPCAYVACRHNLYLDVNENGTIKFNFGDEPEHLHYMQDTCSLDVADRGESTHDAIGLALNVSRERIRQIEVVATGKMREHVIGLADEDDLPEHEHEDLPGPDDTTPPVNVSADGKPRLSRLNELTHLTCRQCGTRLTRGQTPAYRPQKYCSHACSEKAARDRGVKLCKKCKTKKPKSEFARYNNGQLRRTCNACFPPNSSEKFKKGTRWAPNPCAVCGLRFQSHCRGEKLARRKVCSVVCQRAAARNPNRKCRRCGDSIDETNQSRSGSGRIRPATCNKCEGKLYAKSGSQWYFRPSLQLLMARAKRDAERNSLPSSLTRESARQLYAMDCSLCGGFASAWALIDRMRGYVPKNIKPLCDPCVKVNRLMPWPQALLYCQRVAKAQKEKAAKAKL